jgi:hypothetical protein
MTHGSARINARFGGYGERMTNQREENGTEDAPGNGAPADIDETAQPSLSGAGSDAHAADDSPGDEVAPDGITDEQLPEDLRPGDDNPLARPLPDGESADLGIEEARERAADGTEDGESRDHTENSTEDTTDNGTED